MFIVGANLSNSQKVYATGIGFGHDFIFTPKFSVAAEISAQSLRLGRKKDPNFLGKTQLNAQFKLIKGITLFAGPSWSVYYSDASGIPVNGYKTQIGPASRKKLSENTFAWPGVSLGLTIN